MLISYQDYDIESAYKLSGDLSDTDDPLFHDYWLLAANIAWYITERDEATDIIEQAMSIVENTELESNLLKGMMITNLGYMYLQGALTTSELLMRKIEKPQDGDLTAIYQSSKTPMLYRMAIKMIESEHSGNDALLDRLLAVDFYDKENKDNKPPMIDEQKKLVKVLKSPHLSNVITNMCEYYYKLNIHDERAVNKNKDNA